MAMTVEFAKRRQKMANELMLRAYLEVLRRARRGVRSVAEETSGQGTTEYAILVGVLVLMAIVAVMAFRGRLQELWTAITDGINSL